MFAVGLEIIDSTGSSVGKATCPPDMTHGITSWQEIKKHHRKMSFP